MKRSIGFISFAIAILFIISINVYAMTHSRDIISNALLTNIAQTRVRILTVSLTNPTTDYIAYDLWGSTVALGTMTLSEAQKDMFATYIVEAGTTKTFEIKGEYIRYDFCVSLSTVTHGGIFDGGKDHIINTQYDE